MDTSESIRADVVQENGTTIVALEGSLNERATKTLDGAFREVQSVLRVNLRGVTRINSYGIGLLMRVFDRLCRDHKIEFAECSEVMVDQFQMLEFSTYGRITSFYIGYICDRCGKLENRLLDVKTDLTVTREHLITAPSFPCNCGGTQRVEDALDFLEEHL